MTLHLPSTYRLSRLLSYLYFYITSAELSVYMYLIDSRLLSAVESLHTIVKPIGKKTIITSNKLAQELFSSLITFTLYRNDDR